jgi:predicted nucleic acid-binding protein
MFSRASSTRPMNSPIFIDANVPIYAAGRPHTYRESCGAVLLLVVDNLRSFVTDAEVVQELLHRYLARGLLEVGTRVILDFTAALRGQIEPLYVADVELASSLAGHHRGLSARDLAHLAVMQRLGTERIVLADRGFDEIPGLERLDPQDIDMWRTSITFSS